MTCIDKCVMQQILEEITGQACGVVVCFDHGHRYNAHRE